MRGRRRTVLAMGAVLLVLSGLAGCGSGSSSGSAGGGSAAGPATSAVNTPSGGTAGDALTPVEGQKTSFHSTQGIVGNLTKTGPRIIKTAQLSVVVAHGKLQFFTLLPQLDPHLFRFGVSHHIGQRFLGNAEACRHQLRR